MPTEIGHPDDAETSRLRAELGALREEVAADVALACVLAESGATGASSALIDRRRAALSRDELRLERSIIAALHHRADRSER